MLFIKDNAYHLSPVIGIMVKVYEIHGRINFNKKHNSKAQINWIFMVYN